MNCVGGALISLHIRRDALLDLCPVIPLMIFSLTPDNACEITRGLPTRV